MVDRWLVVRRENWFQRYGKRTELQRRGMKTLGAASSAGCLQFLHVGWFSCTGSSFPLEKIRAMLCKGILNPSPLELLAPIQHTNVRTGETVQYANLIVESA